MISGLVVDASIGVAWVHHPQRTVESTKALELLESGVPVYAPELFPVEVANALLVLERRGRIDSVQRIRALKIIAELGVRRDGHGLQLALTQLSEIASEYRLSVYDAMYFELARRTQFPLACRDGSLRQAAFAAGIQIWR